MVVGFDRNINYYKIQMATLCIRENPGCMFIATNTGGWAAGWVGGRLGGRLGGQVGGWAGFWVWVWDG